MNFAFMLRGKAASALQLWGYRWMSGHKLCQAPLTSGLVSSSMGLSSVQPATFVVQPSLRVRRPLRVVRVVDSGQTQTYGGRMLISGRMADVCAELDRLAAREAAENCGRRSGTAISL